MSAERLWWGEERDEMEGAGGRCCPAEDVLGNIGYVRRLWAAFETGGVQAMAELVAPDVRWRPIAAEGRVLNGTRDLDEFWSSREVEIPSLLMFHGAGDDVLVEAEYRREDADPRTVWLLYRFDADRLVEAVGFEEEAQARSYNCRSSATPRPRGVAAVLALGAQAALLGTRFLLADEMPIHEDYRRRLIAATETDAEWYHDLYAVGWPDGSSHRAIHNSTAEMWGAAGRPALGSRPGGGEVLAHFASGEAIVRSEPAPPMAGTTGEIEPLSLWAGQSVALARRSQPAADIVAELVSRL